MSIMGIIKSSPLFYEFFDAEVEQIVERCQVLSLQPGEFVFKEGDQGEDIFIILTGSAQVKKNTVVLADLKKGDLFGEMVLLNNNHRSADIVATTFTDVLVLNYHSIFSFYQTHPKIFSLLILNLSRLLAKRLDQSGQTIRKLNEDILSLKVSKAA
jgi:CRP/FNR family transcriptional regulator, cyclic AMP receptor protein